MSRNRRESTVFAKTPAERADFARRAELHGCTACDVKGHIRESVGITRTMVTIVTMREIEPFGFCAATGPSADWSGIAVGGEDSTHASFVIRLIAMRSKPHCGNPVATSYRPENNGVEEMTQGLLKKLALAAPLVVCLPFCALGADGPAAEAEDSPKIFEEFSLTSATVEAPSPAPCAPAPLPPPPPGAVMPAPNCCSDNCCSSCQHQTGLVECCSAKFLNEFCGETGCPQFFSGVEATMFYASTHGIHADASVENLNNDSTVGLGNDDGFDRFTFSPRIWAGVQEGCWAVLGRFWYMSDSSSGLNPLFPSPGSGIGTFNEERIKAYTADFEVSRVFCCGMSKVNFFLGGRYASFEAGQGFDVSRLTSATDISYSNAFTDFTFNGLGITTGFQGRTPIGCDTCISLVWGLRGSVLWGDANRAVQTSDTGIDTGADATSINSAQSSDCETAFIIEAQLGAQWDHELRCLPMSAFFRVAAEYQYWDLGSGGNVSSTSFSSVSSGFATSHGSIGDVDMNLIGLTVGCGFNW